MYQGYIRLVSANTLACRGIVGCVGRTFADLPNLLVSTRFFCAHVIGGNRKNRKVARFWSVLRSRKDCACRDKRE